MGIVVIAQQSMRFSWAQHQQVARLVQSAMESSCTAAGQTQQGEALALMGVALLMLLQDLAVFETTVVVSPE